MGYTKRGRPGHVSVVIPFRGETEYLEQQLAALTRQDYVGSWDITVSDNGPTAGLDDLLTRVKATISTRGPEIRQVDSSGGSGAAHARNAGTRNSIGDFLVFVDADDLARPDWLSAMIETAAAADMVSGAIVTTELNEPAVAEWRPVPDPVDGWPVADWYPTAIGANIGVWRDVHEAIGGFDQSFIRTAEDTDYAWRAQLAGYSLVHNPKAIVDYRLRSRYRDLWVQMYWYGRGAVSLHKRYRDRGFTVYNNPLVLPLVIGSLLIRNPLIPKRISRLSTGRWIFFVAHEVGKVHGSLVERVVCV